MRHGMVRLMSESIFGSTISGIDQGQLVGTIVGLTGPS